MMQSTVDLNCDLGEHIHGDPANPDARLLQYVSSCNICCGAHAGDIAGITETVRRAIGAGVSIGAHPSYPDRDNFGRVTLSLPRNAVLRSLEQQVLGLKAIVSAAGSRLAHVKPHGALYNDMANDLQLAAEIVEFVGQLKPRLALVGIAGSGLDAVCTSYGVRFIPESFADRRYENRTTLVGRAEAGAVYTRLDEVLQQVDNLLRGQVVDVHGRVHPLQSTTLCLHSDTPHAVELAREIRSHLESLHVTIHPA